MTKSMLSEYVFKAMIPLSLVVVTVLFILLGISLPNGSFWGNVFTNMAATSGYVIVAYITYDFIKRVVNRRNTREIQSYAESRISPQIFYVLYNLMKLVYLDEEIGLVNLLGQLKYSPKVIEILIKKRPFLGFDLFQNSSEISKGIQDLLNSPFLLSRLSENQINLLVRLDNRLRKLYFVLSNKDHIDEINGGAHAELKVIGSEGLSSHNSSLPNRRILGKKLSGKNIQVLRFGDFEDNVQNSDLLKDYKFNDAGVKEVANEVHLIFNLIEEWYKRSNDGLVLRVK